MTLAFEEADDVHTLLGVPYWTQTRDELEQMLRETDELVELNSGNAEISIQARENGDYLRILSSNPTNIIDGQGVRRILQLKYGQAFDRISGSDLTTEVCELAREMGWKVFLLGGCEEASAGAQAFLEGKLPGLQVQRYSPPYESGAQMSAQVEQEICERIAAFEPRVLIGCFGAPKQEFWFDRHREFLRGQGVRVWMGAGGTFDFLSGRVRRAPKAVSDVGLEWMWRFFQEPRQRFGRMGTRLPRFALLGLWEALTYRLRLGRSSYASWGSRVFSLVAVALGLPLALVAGLAVAAANLVAFRDPRRIFFTQPRVGREGKPFRLYKFRTMQECAAPDPLGENGGEGCSSGDFESWSSCEDRLRVTPLGRILRSSHLDELPQLLNILRGDMNLVGPRPEMIEVHEWACSQVPGFSMRTRVRPGLTGLAQVTQGYTGHCAEAYTRKLAIDAEYIQNQSLVRDLGLCAMTVRWMLLGRGWRWKQGAEEDS